MKTVLDLDNTAARDYFLKPNSYCSIDLPEYFSFSQVLDDADKMLSNSSLSQLCISNPKKRPCDVDHVNYELFNNKKNKYQWRRLEIIHPVLYVDLVNTITNTSNWEILRKRFNEFAANKRIICCSIPLADNRLRITTLNWWSAFEQRSIACGLDYSYMGIADVENCYPSIYTHSIAWAIHSESYANSYEQLIVIIVEIMRTNPTVYPICVGMLSDLFVFLKPNTVTKYISRIISRFDKEPFSEYLEIWLQRTSILDDRTRAYDCLLCQKIYQPVNIWNSTWMQNPIDESSIIDENIIADLPARISKNEVDKFNEYDN